MLGRIILFAGYAGAGKSTIINKLLEEGENYVYIPSVSTREKRLNQGESEGKPYYFRTKEEFKEIEEAGNLIESEEIHGNYYGTYKVAYESALLKGKIILKDIGVEGVRSFEEEFGDLVKTVFVKLPEGVSVKDRLCLRGDSVEDIERRLLRIDYEKTFISKFDYVIENGVLEDTVEKVRKIVKNK